MSESIIKQKAKEYLELNKGMALVRKQQKESKKKLEQIESEIKEYMVKNSMDSMVLNEGQIVLYERKVSQTFKKETILEKLTEKLKNADKAEELAESIVKNKKFNIEEKIKAVIKKK